MSHSIEQALAAAKDLFVDVDIVGVPDDGTVCMDSTIWHPWPLYERLALEGRGRMLEVRAEVELRATLERHRGIEHGALREKVGPKAGTVLLIPLLGFCS